MLLPIAMIIAQAAPAAAQPCPATEVALPAGLAGWRETTAGPAIGKSFVVPGADPGTVHGLTDEEVARAGRAMLVPFEVEDEGTYRVALSDGAWIDVVAGPMVLPAVAHGHGPRCSGIHKIVDFRLRRGRYALHISGMKAPSVRVLIARA